MGLFFKNTQGEWDYLGCFHPEIVYFQVDLSLPWTLVNGWVGIGQTPRRRGIPFILHLKYGYPLVN